MRVMPPLKAMEGVTGRISLWSREKFMEPLTFEGQGFLGDAEDEFFKGEGADRKTRLLAGLGDDLGIGFAAHKFANGVGVDERAHDSVLVGEKVAGSGADGIVGRDFEICVFGGEQGAQALEGFGNGFAT